MGKTWALSSFGCLTLWFTEQRKMFVDATTHLCQFKTLHTSLHRKYESEEICWLVLLIEVFACKIDKNKELLGAYWNSIGVKHYLSVHLKRSPWGMERFAMCSPVFFLIQYYLISSPCR